MDRNPRTPKVGAWPVERLRRAVVDGVTFTLYKRIPPSKGGAPYYELDGFTGGHSWCQWSGRNETAALDAFNKATTEQV